jgi:hypothetical protein
MDTAIVEISHPLATMWVGREQRERASFFYGGTRLVDPATTDTAATSALIRLMKNESGIKNRLINRAFHEGALDDLRDELPPGLLHSRVGGARCLIRPRTPEIAAWLADPLSHHNRETTASVLQRLSDALNAEESRIKLTPDFGRYAGLADILHEFTPNVLGIRCERGGCGGKSSYSTTGVLAGVETAAPRIGRETRVTCIGSAGAMGSGVLDHFLRAEVTDLGACDLVYDTPQPQSVPGGAQHLPSQPGAFTRECLERGEVIVATTIGDELEKSPYDCIPAGSHLFLAHNNALPDGDRGIELARTLSANGVLAIPGQLLTLGGALTARIEWYWRQMPEKREFDKPLAHRVVHRTVSYLVGTTLAYAASARITPYEAMLALAMQEDAMGGLS